MPFPESTCCDHCEMDFPNMDKLFKHLSELPTIPHVSTHLNIHISNTITCWHCKGAFPNKRQLFKHLPECTAEAAYANPVICRNCSHLFSVRSELHCHLATCKPKAIKSKSTKCQPHSFPLLPQEIKDIIWKYAVRDIKPRIIDLMDLHTTPSRYPPNTLLHICQDSRKVFLNSYKPWGGYEYNYDYIEHNQRTSGIASLYSWTYIDFSKDRLVLKLTDTVGVMPPTRNSGLRLEISNANTYFEGEWDGRSGSATFGEETARRILREAKLVVV